MILKVASISFPPKTPYHTMRDYSPNPNTLVIPETPLPAIKKSPNTIRHNPLNPKSQDVLKKELWGCLRGFWISWSYFLDLLIYKKEKSYFFLETFGLLVALMFVLMHICWNNCRRSHQVEPQVQLHQQAR